MKFQFIIGLTAMMLLALVSIPVFGQGCPSEPEQKLNNCNVSDPNDGDECMRLLFTYYFDYIGTQQPEPAGFEASGANINFQITGEGYFDISKCTTTYPYGQFALVNPKELVWFISCVEDPPYYQIPFGDCQSPIVSISVVGEPGSYVTITPPVTSLYFDDNVNDCEWEDRCIIASIINGEAKASAPACSEDFTLRIDGIPTGDPGEEVQLYLVLENNSASAITLDELDFRIKIEDAYGNLGAIALDPNTNNNDPPAISWASGGEYYYLLNSLMGGNTVPAGSEVAILAFSINEPEGLENLLGQANISVNFARINIAGGTCCQVDESGAIGTVTFPGELPCEALEPEVRFLVQSMAPGTLEECQTGVEIIAFVLDQNQIPTSTQVRSLFFDLMAHTSGNLQIVSMEAPAGVNTNFDCLMEPCGQGSNYPICFGCSAQFQYDGTGFTLTNGDRFIIIFGGLNGQLDALELLQAYIMAPNEQQGCIPEIDFDPGLLGSFPIVSGCNFCNNINLTTGPYSENSEPLEFCEQGFSVWLDISGNSIGQGDEIVIEFDVLSNGPINLEAFPILCNLNGNNSCMSPGQSACLSVNNNRITYRYCLPSGSINGAWQLLDVKFSYAGAGQNGACATGIFFTENTKIYQQLQGNCRPYYGMSNDPFPLCSSCDPDVNTVSGTIHKENGVPVLIVLNANPDPNPVTCTHDPLEGITMRAGQESGGGCFCASTGCAEEITGTTLDPCGFYTEVFNCPENYFSIIPFKNTGWTNGVTTFDLVLIRRHILHVELLDSPYKIIAADAISLCPICPNAITTADELEIRKLILNIIQKYSQRPSWRFIPANYIFPNPSEPWAEEFPVCITLDMSNQSEAQDQDFIAIKVGDVNLSATTGCPSFKSDEPEERAATRATLHCAASRAVAGEELEASFYVQHSSDLVAWQAGLWFDPEYLELQAALPGELDYMKPWNFGLTEKTEGKVRVLWFAEDAQAATFEEPREAFRLKFRVKRAFSDWSAVLKLQDEVLQNTAWEAHGEEHGLALQFRTDPFPNREELKREAAVTAVPNPISGRLLLRVELPEDEWISVAIYDATGRRVAGWQGETTVGIAEVNFRTSDWGKGAFTYRVLTARQVLTGTLQQQ